MKTIATLLALCLSTPVAAATFTFDFPALPPGTSTVRTSETFAFQGSGTGGISYAIDWEQPPALDPGVWEYYVMTKVINFSLDRGDFLSGSIFGQCYYSFGGCIPEFSPPLAPLVGDIIRFDLQWFSDGLYAGLRPEFALRFTVPDGVSVSPVPLPAAWLLFASGLGLFYRRLTYMLNRDTIIPRPQ